MSTKMKEKPAQTGGLRRKTIGYDNPNAAMATMRGTAKIVKVQGAIKAIKTSTTGTLHIPIQAHF